MVIERPRWTATKAPSKFHFISLSIEEDEGPYDESSEDLGDHARAAQGTTSFLTAGNLAMLGNSADNQEGRLSRYISTGRKTVSGHTNRSQPSLQESRRADGDSDSTHWAEMDKVEKGTSPLFSR